MAIARVKKIEIVGLEKDKEAILALLQKLGAVELISIQKESESVQPSQAAAIDVQLLEIEEAITYLSGFQEKAGLLEGMIKLRPLVYQRQLEEVVLNFDYSGLITKIKGLRNELNDLLHRKEKLTQERLLLSPWRKLNLALDEIHSTEECALFLGVLNVRDYPNLKDVLEEENVRLFIEVVNQDRTNLYLLICCIKDDFERLQMILKNYHFNFVVLPKSRSTVKDRLFEINSGALILDDQIQDIKNNIIELSKERFKLMVVYDYLANIGKRYDTDKILAKQQFTFCLSGWIRYKDIKLLEEEITQRLKDVAMFISDPQPNENIPTTLENMPVIRPFEVVTNLYGQPIYNGLDPTGFLVPFFAISFGFCLLDAGYGLILFLLMLFFLKKKQISEHGKMFLKFFRYVSIAAMIAGLATGSFFGDLISRLPESFSVFKNIQRSLKLFDPVKDSLVFLSFTLMLGFIQVWTGVFIRFTRDLDRNRFAAFMLDLPTLIVQTSLLMLVLIFFKVLPTSVLKYALILLGISALTVVYYQLKANREISLKIFWSVFGIYSIITGNFLADTLSFSRIFALGLTGGLLGMAINQIVPIVPSILEGILGGVFGVFKIKVYIPVFINMLIITVVFIISHIINLGICTLGAYVHTSRLQYLEFFTKFFESGGRPFKPFKEENKYIYLVEK